MAVPVDNLTETGHALAWMAEDGIRLHWIVGKFSKALGRWEDYDEALVRTWAESNAPDEAVLVHEADLPEKAARSTAIIRDGRVIAAAAWRVSQWQAKVNAALDKADRIGGPRAMREALSATAPRLAHIERWASDLRALAWDGEGDEPLIPELGPFYETAKPTIDDVQAELSAALDELDAVTAPAEPDLNVIPEQLAVFAQADETADDFRIRLKQLWQRFGIDDGEHFVGGGEPLTGEEKIAMREIDILLNSDEGHNAGLLKWLYPDGTTN